MQSSDLSVHNTKLANSTRDLRRLSMYISDLASQLVLYARDNTNNRRICLSIILILIVKSTSDLRPLSMHGFDLAYSTRVRIRWVTRVVNILVLDKSMRDLGRLSMYTHVVCKRQFLS